MPTNTARETLWPTNPNILVRTVVLYVGQGASAIVLVASNGGYKTMLIDINLDRKNGGIDVPALIKDLVGNDGLDVFVNTHPHDDHLRGIEAVSDLVSIREIWHSGHVPSRKHGATYYDEFVSVVKKVKDDGGTETVLVGSRSEQSIGDGKYYVLAPAEYVTDDVNEDEADARYQRIHEQCAVLKFGTAGGWSIIVGDADRDAFEKHITEYHKERLFAVFLAGAHHGSRTFFRYDEKDEPYVEGLDAIGPDYVVISAPRQTESRHGHPHDDAMKIYRDKVGAGDVLHTGEKRYSFICDIYRDGTYGGVEDDQGVLAEAYPLEDGDGDGNGKASSVAKAIAPAPFVRTRVDDRPMGSSS